MTTKNNLNLEVYEFILNGYSNDLSDSPPSKNMFNTTKLTTVSADTCGYISTDEEEMTIKDKIVDKRPRSCDSIDGIIEPQSRTGTYTSLPFVLEDDKKEIYFKLNEIPSYDLLEFTYYFYTKQHNKDSMDIGTVKYTIPSMKKLYDVKEINSTIEKAKELLNKQRGIVNHKTHDFIKVLRPNVTDKFIIIGDIHGSYATFIRILLRLRKMKVFDENCKFDDNYHLVFLGDIIDRGTYGLEILMLIYYLKLANPENIHINNGNHEEHTTNSKGGFGSHLVQIFNKDNAIAIWTNFNNLFLLNHSALMIENPNKKGEYCYLAHGGFPLDTTEASITAPIKKPGCFPSEFNETSFNDELNKIFIPISKTSKTIRWADFYGLPDVEFNSARISGWIIGTNLIDRANKMGIKMVIRGHQDSLYNTKLIKKGAEYDLVVDINTVPPHDSLTVNNKVCYGYTNLIKLDDSGNLVINDIDASIYIPVITISTNTDLGRDLTRDCFTILKFIEEFNPEIRGCVEEKTKEETDIKRNIRRAMIVGSDSGAAAFKEKYLKYKNKYLRLKAGMTK